MSFLLPPAHFGLHWGHLQEQLFEQQTAAGDSDSRASDMKGDVVPKSVTMCNNDPFTVFRFASTAIEYLTHILLQEDFC